MHNIKHAYPYNMNTLENPIDTRSYPLLSSGGGRGKKNKNYAGRQIGCRTRARRRARTMTRTRTRSRSRSRSRSRQQSGGNIVNDLPMDASMLVQSATKVGADLWNDLKGTPSVNPSPFPFIDQGIKNPTPISEHQTQAGGRGRKRRRRNPITRNRRGHRSKSKQSKQSKRLSQSGGDLFSYLPFDMSTTARSALTGIENAFSGTKGLPGSVSPLPYNDHALQKPELKASDHLPNLPQYYKNANLSIPSL